MTQKQIPTEDKAPLKRKPQPEGRTKDHAQPTDENTTLTNLQQQVGNRAVQRLIAQRQADEPFDLDDDTAERINHQRSGGQPLDSGLQDEMSQATGHDLKDVRVHTSPESDELNQQLGAKAFTTGKDIFFREGEYDPDSRSGQELIAHEITHVVQQGTAQVSGQGKMKVNPPGDEFERQADAVARSLTSPGTAAKVQRQEEEEEIQMQVEEEEEEEEIQMQEEEEEEEEVQMQEMEEEEELAT